MPKSNTYKDLAKNVDRSSTATFDAKLGTTVDELVVAFGKLLAKLDADAGVTDTTYTSLLKVKRFSER